MALTNRDIKRIFLYESAMPERSQTCDFLVIGSGLAGLAYALKVADLGTVMILSKSEAPATNTAMAQGGIAAVVGDDDSFENHVRDTLVAGAGLCREDIVRRVVEEAPARVEELVRWGVPFDARTAEGQPVSSATSLKTADLTREGGHSHRRILHVQDHTGQDIHERLMLAVRQHPNIEIREQHFAVDLILEDDSMMSSRHPRAAGAFRVEPSRVIGAHVFDRGRMKSFDVFARVTLLATGGAGKVYLYTSNWSGATGDGIAMAWRAGARVANLEFMQFHPTCLYHPQARNFLITEALRGEGAELVNAQGEAFAKRYHPLGALAPRDIVARSIDAEMKKTGAECMFLDITHQRPEFLRERFPVIYKTCFNFGIDMTRQPIPIVPAAHYLCGGVITDADARTDLPGLLCAGESACTGLHGANRLASNSLLEAVVFADRAAQTARRWFSELGPALAFESDWTLSGSRHEDDERIAIAHMWDEIRRLMWNYVGIVRSNRRLAAAQARLNVIRGEIERDHQLNRHPDAIELRNIATVAELTVRCAMRRRESRGIHYNIDFPHADESRPAMDTILTGGI
ncbi:MAG TPA: L-aspartate oxidase [Pseudobdellovibrionaceae bacterium]|nr:L-aspartate oxidase [Pseudobdellovibrionaceae bacterium]